MLAHESIDQPNQLTSSQCECTFMLVRFHLIKFFLVIGRILWRETPSEVCGLNEIIAKIMVAGLSHFRVIGFEIPRLALAPGDTGVFRESPVGVKLLDGADF